MEGDWKAIFAVETDPEEKAHKPLASCNANCMEAKEIKCVCSCGGVNHGIALRRNVKPLEAFNESEGEAE